MGCGTTPFCIPSTRIPHIHPWKIGGGCLVAPMLYILDAGATIALVS